MTALSVNVTNSRTMSSREIAELTGKRHRDVTRDIANVLNQLDLDARSFAHIYLDGSNRQQTEYLLPRRECEILVTGYDVVRRAAVIDRWLELESSTRLPATTGNAYLDALLETQRQVSNQDNRLSTVETSLEQVAETIHRADDLLNQIGEISQTPEEGFIRISDARRRYGRGLSDTVFKRFISLMEVESKPLRIVMDNGVVTETTQVNVEDVLEMMNDVVSRSVRVTPRFYMHQILGDSRFQINM